MGAEAHWGEGGTRRGWRGARRGGPGVPWGGDGVGWGGGRADREGGVLAVGWEGEGLQGLGCLRWKHRQLAGLPRLEAVTDEVVPGVALPGVVTAGVAAAWKGVLTPGVSVLITLCHLNSVTSSRSPSPVATPLTIILVTNIEAPRVVPAQLRSSPPWQRTTGRLQLYGSMKDLRGIDAGITAVWYFNFQKVI